MDVDSGALSIAVIPQLGLTWGSGEAWQWVLQSKSHHY